MSLSEGVNFGLKNPCPSGMISKYPATVWVGTLASCMYSLPLPISRLGTETGTAGIGNNDSAAGAFSKGFLIKAVGLDIPPVGGVSRPPVLFRMREVVCGFTSESADGWLERNSVPGSPTKSSTLNVGLGAEGYLVPKGIFLTDRGIAIVVARFS